MWYEDIGIGGYGEEIGEWVGTSWAGTTKIACWVEYTGICVEYGDKWDKILLEVSLWW